MVNSLHAKLVVNSLSSLAQTQSRVAVEFLVRTKDAF